MAGFKAGLFHYLDKAKMCITMSPQTIDTPGAS
jgi:hypothetical protein